MSRQREYQRQMRFEGRCIICGVPAADSRRKGNDNGKSAYCPSHLISVRERNRANNGVKRRNWHAVSYKDELNNANNTDNSDDGGGEP